MALCFVTISIMMIVSSYSQAQDCLFTDTNTGSFQLDLRPLNELKLEHYDGSLYKYAYSICANNLGCTPYGGKEVFVMIDQHEPENNRTTPDECWWLAQWNDTDIKQPAYNSISQTWEFPTFEGMHCLSGTRETKLYWRCNETVETAYIVAVNQPSNCSYSMIMESKYACLTSPPQYCKWFAQGGAMLDLTTFDETIITAIDTSQRELIFSYTPCRNGLICNSMDVMAKLDNITDSECTKYLSEWDDDNENNVHPFYDEINKVWEFQYLNGETCDNQLPSAFYVYWFCNPAVIAPNYIIKKAENVAPCLYELEIESNLVC